MIIQGDCLDEMRKMADNSISAIVTDPPYGISFMGKNWDKGIPSQEYWKEMLRVVKPGGHLLVAGLPRMMHRLISVIEDSGWQIRDLLMHVFGSGFPKSHNHFGIEGYGTALKPAWEGWSLAMKPLDGTFKHNAEKWGQAGINIDDSRIGDRWPSNFIIDEGIAERIENASRFFYCPKASSRERNEGLEGMPEKENPFAPMGINDDEGIVARGRNPENQSRKQQNHHPTVKPLKLMEYLIKLVMPPKDGILLDPFAGSGTTILAAKRLGFDAIGIEKVPDYCDIARKRIENFME